ncbi:MAG: sugar phosphate isomerase/epimerase [Rhodothermales bacterium]|jgi:sugar phosphate isomerase/epimerase
MDRRVFLGRAALGAAGLTAGTLGAGRALAADPDSLPTDSEGRAVFAQAPASSVRLGVASYSLRNLSREVAIEAIVAIGTPLVNIKSFHIPQELTPLEIAGAVAQFRAAGLDIVGGGTISFPEDTDESMRTIFEYIKACGFPVVVAAPAPEMLPRLETFAIEYDVKIAIHNHGPEDAHFPAPSDAIALVRDMDKRMGVCVDLGHTARTGKDVIRELAIAGDRLHDIHMKDLADLSDKASQCIVGRGQMPVAGVFRQLMAMEYPGVVNLEYEIDGDNPLPGMQQSFAYMRGVLAGMAG